MVYRLKVKIKRGAYLGRKRVERTMEVPGSSTLEGLCSAILNAVDFDFDHLYEFIIDGRTYEGSSWNGAGQCRAKLDSLRLQAGDRFELRYDFGDDWVFSIMVEEIRKERGRGITILSGKGKVEQYPYNDSEQMELDFPDEIGEDFADASPNPRGKDTPEEPDETDGPDGTDDPEDPDEMDDPELEEALEGLIRETLAGMSEEELDMLLEEELEKSIPGGDANMEDTYHYTPPDALYERAFRYKKTKLWKTISSDCPFAIRFTDGTDALVCVMGQLGDHVALSVYVGDNAYRGYYSLSTQPPFPEWYYEKERLYSQDCLQIVFDNQEYLMKPELEAARAYAKKNGIRFSGANAFPHFSRYSPSKQPWHLRNEKEEQYLIEAAEAAIAVSEMLKKKKPVAYGFSRFTPFLREVPYVTFEDGKWSFSGMWTLPQVKKPVYIQPVPDPDKMAALKKLRAKDTLQARIVMFPGTVLGENGEAPFFPYVLLASHKEEGKVLSLAYGRSLAQEAGKMADDLLQELLSLEWKPAKIVVEEERTFAFLEPVAKGIGVKLVKAPFLDPLDEMIENFMTSFGNREWDEDEDWGDEDGWDDDGDWDDEDDWDDDDEDLDEDDYEELIAMMQTITSLPNSAIKVMPRILKEQIREILEMEVLPPDLARQVRKKLKL